MTDDQANQLIMSNWLMQIIQRLDSLLTNEFDTQQNFSKVLSAIEHATKTLVSSFNSDQTNSMMRFQQAVTQLMAFYRGKPLCGVKQLQEQMEPFLMGEKNNLESHWQKATRFTVLQQSSDTFQSEMMMEFAEYYCPKLVASLYHHDASLRSESVIQLKSQLQAISQNQRIDICHTDLRHVQLVRAYASSSQDIHSQGNANNPISHEMIESWQQEWLSIKAQANNLIKNAKQNPEHLSSVIHALPLLLTILERDNASIDDLAYARVQQLMKEQPLANSLTADDVRLFDNVHSQPILQQAIMRAVKRHINLENQNTITPGLAVLLSWAKDTDYLESLLLSIVEKSLKDNLLSPNNANKPLNNIIKSVEQLLSPYQRLSTNQTLINHLQSRMGFLLSTAIERMEQNETCSISSLLKQADFSSTLQYFCKPTQVKTYRLELYYQWIKQNRFTLSALQNCPYGNTLEELASYFGVDVLNQCLNSHNQALLYDKSDSVFVYYLQGLLQTSSSLDKIPLLKQSMIHLQQAVSERLHSLSDAEQVVKNFQKQPTIVLEVMKNKFSTIDPSLLSCAYVVSGKLGRYLTQKIQEMASSPSDEQLIQAVSTSLTQITATIMTITQRLPAYKQAFQSLQVLISNILLWVEQGRHPIQYQTLFEALADVNLQFENLPRCEFVRCSMQLAPLWETTGRGLVLDYEFLNRQEKIQQGGHIVNHLSRLNMLFGGELETQYRTTYQQYQEYAEKTLHHCSEDDQLTLRIQSTWTRIYNRSPFFKLAEQQEQPLALDEIEASALTQDPGKAMSLNLD